MMHLLKNIPIGVDKLIDGIDFSLNLYSKGSKPNYNDDFPREIVRVTGARFAITNKTSGNIVLEKLILGIFVQEKIVAAYTTKDHPALIIGPNRYFEVAFEGNELREIFNDYKEEKGIIIIQNKNFIHHSSFFDGDLIENKLKRLNDDTDPEYQNWNTHEFSKLEYQIPINEVDERIKQLSINF